VSFKDGAQDRPVASAFVFTIAANRKVGLVR
jgi:hypothetical protein